MVNANDSCYATFPVGGAGLFLVFAMVCSHAIPHGGANNPKFVVPLNKSSLFR